MKAMSTDHLIQYVTKFKPQHDIWRYTLAELGIGGTATTAGLLLANGLKRKFQKEMAEFMASPAAAGGAKPPKAKFGSPQFVAALVLLEAVYEFSKVPAMPAPPRLVLSPEDNLQAKPHQCSLHYLVSLTIGLTTWKIETGRADADELITSLVSQIELATAQLHIDDDSDVEDVQSALTAIVPCAIPSTLSPSNREDLSDWSERYVKRVEIQPIAIRWLGVVISPYYPKLGLKLTSFDIIMPEILDMAEDDFVSIAQKVGKVAFDAVVNFIGELLHWRVVREARSDEQFYDVLGQVRQFAMYWDEPAPVTVQIV